MNYHYYVPTQKVPVPDRQRIVLVGGCFDILHFGHIQFLDKAKKTGDYLIIALEPDETIIQYKKRIPIHNQEQRAYNLVALRSVDQVILLPSLQGFDDYYMLVKNINPHIIAITQDDPQIENKQKQADAIGAQLIIVSERIEPFSSSSIQPLNLFLPQSNIAD
jgi:cytidyltransferase-like protein